MFASPKIGEEESDCVQGVVEWRDLVSSSVSKSAFWTARISILNLFCMFCGFFRVENIRRVLKGEQGISVINRGVELMPALNPTVTLEKKSNVTIVRSMTELKLSEK